MPYSSAIIDYRFNRYIVECKLRQSLDLYLPVCRFNRYIVECKSVEGDSLKFSWLGFNRYIVECKYYTVLTQTHTLFDLIDT